MAILGDPQQQSEQEENRARPLCPTSASNDPWRLQEGNESSDAPDDATSGDKSFTDSFRPPIERLPDSVEYLAALEAKLVRVQKKGSLVRDLQKKREDAMRRFIDSQDDAVRGEQSDWVSPEDIASGTTENPIIRRIAPERQVYHFLIMYTIYTIV